MKTIKTTLSGNWFRNLMAAVLVLLTVNAYSQLIVVDGASVLASDQAKFPFWLRAAQTLASGTNVISISVIEYNVTASPSGGNILTLEQVVKVTASQTVPAAKVWKVEAVLMDPSVSTLATIWIDDGTVVRLATNTDNVGIGNSTPATKLDVTGSINSSAGYRIGNAATTANYLRGNGADFVSSSIQVGDVPILNQSTTGNASTATNVAYSGLTAIPLRSAWVGVHRNFVAEQLSWKNYGNSHTVFDASAGTSPDGGAVSNTNSQVAWAATYPTLMGWNGANTYGVRVDAARVSDNGVPAGAVFHFASSSVPSGYLECNGGAVSRSTYAALFAVIGTTHGAGDGSTTFNVPNLRGEFIRGADNGRGVDAGRVLGSAQAQDFKSFSMYNSNPSSADYSHGPVYFAKSGLTGNLFGAYWSNPSGKIQVEWDASEIRPRNVALLACIKF